MHHSGPVHEAKLSLRWVMWILYNFTRTDLKTIVLPQTLFSLAGALSGYPLTARSFDPAHALLNAPSVIAWLWLNLLVFTLANQRLPGSIVEDKYNKPWRNIPSSLITADASRKILIATISVSWWLSSAWGVWNEFAALCILIWIYNDLGGAEEHFILRNFLNAGGYVFYGLGGLKIASGSYLAHDELPRGSPAYLGPASLPWALLTGLAVATTIQVQDLQDQVGDRIRGRQTLPLAWGDRFCRWTVACSVTFWTLIFIHFWKVSFTCCCLFGFISVTLAARVVYLGYNGLVECAQRASEDERTFLHWCIWLGIVYLLPLCTA